MYLRYFDFHDHPFSITPDPAFLYLSASHREALGHLLYGTGEHGGFVQLTGEVGTGKTTLIRALLEQEHEVADVDVALCLNPQLTVNELLATICDELNIKYNRKDLGLKPLVDRLNQHLLQTHAAGRRTVLILDEAQNLSREVLEQLRLLTNLETGKHKLLRIILVAQPELEEMLARPDMRQLAQRITARFHLKALKQEESCEYIWHRLRVAGGDPDIIPRRSCAAIHRYADGTPRLINTICERALMGAYANGKKQVSVPMVRHAVRETLPRAADSSEQETLLTQLAPVLVLVAAAAFAFGLHYFMSAPTANGPDAPVLAQAGLENDAPSELSSEIADTAESTKAPTAQNAQSEPEPEPVYELPEGNATMGQLLRLWGVFGSEVLVDCRDLRIGDLRCLREEGNLSDLEKFNRPSLLTLSAGGRSAQVVLSNLSDDKATLVFADQVNEWPRSEVERLWTGEFQTVWRLHTSTRNVGEGSVGDSVSWLRRQLAKARGENPDARAGQPSPIFDTELQQQLVRFQQAAGLQADGVVGSRTMMALNNVAPPPGTPLLNAKYGFGRQPETVVSQAAPAQENAAADAGTGQACRVIENLPATQALVSLPFGPNATDLSPPNRASLTALAEQVDASVAEVVVAGTSYNPNMPAGQLRNLALARARTVARALAQEGIAAERIACVTRTGKRAPSAELDRVALVYTGAAQAR